MTPVSICVIMKNEEKNMDKFLSSIKKAMGKYPYELVLVDTGSSDRTIEIARKYTDNIHHFDWIDDFSAARNYSLKAAKNDWILVLDCDEYVTDIKTECFDMMIRQNKKAVGLLSRRSHYEMNGTDSVCVDEVERFFDRREYHYEAIIHEQVRGIDGNDKYVRIALPIMVEHSGYEGTFEELRKKAERNNQLLFKMLEERPDDPYLYFQIGQSYNMIHDDEKAYYYYGKGLEFDVDPNADYVRMMVVAYGYNMLHLGKYEEALSFQGIYEEFGCTPEFVCLMGLIYLRNGMIIEAMAEFLKATTFETASTQGANSFIPYFNMGCVNEVLGDVETAVELYKKCGDFKPAVDRLKALV